MGAETASRTDQKSDSEQPAADYPVSVSALAFGLLTVLIEAAARHLDAPVPGLGETHSGTVACDLGEARLAIDAANALLGAIASRLSSQERVAIEGLLTQLQLQYVKLAT